MCTFVPAAGGGGLQPMRTARTCFGLLAPRSVMSTRTPSPRPEEITALPITDVVTQLLPYIGYPRTLNALRVIDEVSPA
jgi:hypothetical protein